MIYPDKMLKMMSEEDRAKLGASGFTSAEAQSKYAARNEKQMHSVVSGWLKVNGYHYVHSSFGRKSTNAAGTPDFTILFGGRGCFLELKDKGGKLMPDQEAFYNACMLTETPMYVCYSSVEAIDTLRKFFTVTK
jgi:hypothetical protein